MVELVVDELDKLKISVLVAILVHLQALGLHEGLVVWLLDDLVGLVDDVVVHDCLRQDGELSVVSWVELHLNELLRSARKLVLLHHEKLFLLCIPDCNLEIRDSADDYKIFAVS